MKISCNFYAKFARKYLTLHCVYIIMSSVVKCVHFTERRKEMSKFEQVGVNLQYNAESRGKANKAFEYSCNACCSKGNHLDCDRCAIAVAHNLVIAIFDDMERK